MKSVLLYVSVGLLAFTGFRAAAGPLRRSDVAADPSWVLHLDVDGLRPTAIGEYIQTEMEKPEAQARLAAFQALFSFDLKTQLHGLTLYGTGNKPEDGVLLVYADFDPERLVTLARAAKDAHETTYKKTTIYSWLDTRKKHKDGETPRTYAAIYGKCVIFGQREECVSQALDVLSGAAATLASSQLFPQLGTPGSSSFLEAAARKLDFSAAGPNAAILRLAKLVRFQLGESQQQVSAVLTLDANDEEVAKNMNSIAQGLIALMKVQTEKPESVKIGEALKLKQEGAKLVVSLHLPANEAVEMMKAGAARRAHHKAAGE